MNSNIYTYNRLFILLVVSFLLSFKTYAQKELFSEFLKNFSQDSSFQMQRVVFPLKMLFVEEEDFFIDSTLIKVENYRINRFQFNLINCSEAYPVIYSNFKCEEEDVSDERVFRWKGFSGMDERYFFRRKEGKWWLVRVEILGI